MSAGSALVVGHGSIGQRHARLLAELGLDVAVVSRRPLALARLHGDLRAAVAAEQPGYVVIATETAHHLDALVQLAELDYRGRVLVDKPLLAAPAELPAHRFASLHVGYNLRFHPLVRRIEELLRTAAPLTAAFHVGQHLPTWRPGRDYRTTASAARGSGGVLRDLSHELDYLTWMLGAWSRVTAIAGRFGQLEIESEDACALLIETERCPLVSVHMDYLDRIGVRRIVVNTSEWTLHADLIAGTLHIGEQRETFAVGRDDTYRAMHQAVLAGGDPALCDAAAGAAVVELIAAAERAAAAGSWVRR